MFSMEAIYMQKLDILWALFTLHFLNVGMDRSNLFLKISTGFLFISTASNYYKDKVVYYSKKQNSTDLKNILFYANSSILTNIHNRAVVNICSKFIKIVTRDVYSHIYYF